MRIIFVIGAFISLLGIVAYLALWLILPDENTDFTGLDYLKSRYENRT